MLALMWSKDAAIRDSVMQTYKELYLSPDPAAYPSAKARRVDWRGMSSCWQVRAGVIVKNLITLVNGATLGDLTCLEELVSRFAR